MKIGFWDIENTPLTAYTWSLWPHAISIDQIRESAEMMSFAWKWRGQKGVKFFSTFHDGKEAMLEALWGFLHEADAVVSWNGIGHDTKHANREFLEAGMKPPAPFKEIDLMQAVKKRFKFPSNKLDYVTQTLGLPGKVKTDFELWLLCMLGDEKAWNRMRTYNKRDVTLLEEVYDRLLPWIPGHPNVALYGGDTEEHRCPACGGDELAREGHAYTQLGKFQRYRCLNEACGKWSRSGRAVARVDLRAVAS